MADPGRIAGSGRILARGGAGTRTARGGEARAAPAGSSPAGGGAQGEEARAGGDGGAPGREEAGGGDSLSITFGSREFPKDEDRWRWV